MITNNLGHIALLAIVAVLGQGALAQSGSRSLPACYEPGVSFAVSVTITLNNAPGWGAEERVPQGWNVTGINNGGSFSSAQSRVRWLSLSQFNGPLTLSYTVTPPSNTNGVQSFSGDFSIDGANAPTAGSASISKCEEPCEVSISPDQTVSSPAGSTTFNITSGGAWSVSSNQTWATVSPASGTGNGAVTVTYTANAGTTPRSATIAVNRSDCSGGSDTALVRQDPPACTITLLPAEQTVSSIAISSTFQVTSIGAWSMSSSEPWATVTPTTGTGNGTVQVSYGVNEGDKPRTTTLSATRTDCTGGSNSTLLTQNSAVVDCIGVPGSVDASNGLFTGSIRVSWAPVNGATGYKIYRGNTGSAFSSAPLLATVDASTTVFDDDPVPRGTDEWTIEAFGCQTSVPSGETPPFPYLQCGVFTGGVFGFPYTYWVTAIKDDCESEPSDPDEGYSFKSNDEGARLSEANMGDLTVLAALGLVLVAAKAFIGATRRKLMH